jgi:hypothetical protein
MALNLRSPSLGDGDTRPAHSYPISRSLAFLVLLALVALFALRHVFGSIHAEAGVR